MQNLFVSDWHVDVVRSACGGLLSENGSMQDLEYIQSRPSGGSVRTEAEADASDNQLEEVMVVARRQEERGVVFVCGECG